MTKRVNWLPNLRVDVPDITAGTNTLSSGLLQQNFKQFILDHFARISAGFRVAIANQILSPGQFTVYNGIGFDRSGQIMQNEDEENASRSLTILADGQYFVEVQFVTDQTNTDARGFWDPTVDNGTDPSGDVRLPGREFSQNTATRLTPDWQIVSPISTTGFEINTLPNSLKVPVACINVVAGVISGAVPVNARTVLSASVPAFVSLITVLDSRIFPDTFNATVDAEAIVVIANDRVNGRLTLAANLALPHTVGARVAITGVGLQEFLPERTTPPLPTSGSADARPHFWQGDEERGFALAQNPYAGTGRADVSLQAMKDQVDFLSAQIREMRFGAELNANVGQLAPPASFPLSPRYFDKSGGLQGARYATCSIGDGVTSWGDFNVAQMGSAAAALTAALAALPATGGHIHFKASATPYAFGNVVISKPCVISGEGQAGTVLVANGATAALTINASVELYNLRVNRGVAATTLFAVDCAASVKVIVRDCYIEGMDFTGHDSVFDGVTFNTAIAALIPLRIAILATTTNTTFSKCTFVVPDENTTAVVAVNPVDGLTFSECTFTAPSIAGSCIGVFLGTANRSTISGSKFTNFAYSVFVNIGTAVKIIGNSINHTGVVTGRKGIEIFTSLTDFDISNNTITDLNDFAGPDNAMWGIHLCDGATRGSISNNIVRNVGVGGTGLGFAYGLGLGKTFAGANIFNLNVSGNTFERMDCSDLGHFCAGIIQINGLIDSVISGNMFRSIGDFFAGPKFFAAAYTNGTLNSATPLLGCTFADNTIDAIGNGGCFFSEGLHLDIGATGATVARNTYTGNVLQNISSLITSHGISIIGGCRSTTVTGNSMAGFIASAAIIGINIRDSAAQAVQSLTVTSNVLGEGGADQFTYGIYVNAQNVVGTGYTFSDNTINGYFNGIFFFGAGANESVTATGNALWTLNGAGDGIHIVSSQIVTVSNNVINQANGAAITDKRNIVVDNCFYVTCSANVCKRFSALDLAFPGVSANVVFFSCNHVAVTGNVLVENVPGGAPCIGFLNYGTSFIYYATNMFTHPFGAAVPVANYDGGTDIDGRAFTSAGLYPAVPVSFATIGLNWFE